MVAREDLHEYAVEKGDGQKGFSTLLAETIQGVVPMQDWAGVIMAAGNGTRMKSKLPKPLHKLCGREMVCHPVEALRSAGVAHIVVVVSPEAEAALKELLGDRVEYVRQSQPLGTGHALLQAAALLEGRSARIAALNADTPLVRPATLERLFSHHDSKGSTVTLLTSITANPDGMARVVRDSQGKVVDILEESEVDTKRESAEMEVNGGAYCFDGSWLWDNLRRVPKSPSGEIYLTSLVNLASSQGSRVEAEKIEEHQEVLGINNRQQLAEAEAIMRRRIREHWMIEGVTIIDPPSTFIDAAATVGQDTVLYPNTMVLGHSEIGGGCAIGPGTVIQDSVVGSGSKVIASFLEESTLEESVHIGPFSHLRPGAYLERGVHLGNFAEIKNSRLGQGVAMGHFGYLGDASVGANVNLGAGMVTCNYDGVAKHVTVVEEGAFIGCDTMLVAPVTVGTGATTGAGSVITKDVPPGRLAVGVPATIRERKGARR